MSAVLNDSELLVEYATIRDPALWTEHSPTHHLVQARGLIAAWLDGVRLIDNLSLSEGICEQGAQHPSE